MQLAQSTTQGPEPRDVEPLFRVATVATSLVGFVERSPELFSALGLTPVQIAQGRALEGVISGLLGGLVPIRARVLTYRVVRDRDQLSVVQVGLDDVSRGSALYLVGVAEQRLFWKDIRRVLFSRGRYKVLARIAEDGIQGGWTPIKLSHVLEQIVPGFETRMGDLTALMAEPSAREGAALELRMKPALSRFVELFARKEGDVCSENEIGAAKDYVAGLAEGPLRYENWKSETQTVTEILLGPNKSSVTPDELATLREEAKAVERAELSGVQPAAGEGPSGEPEHVLDCELVAIYW